MTRNLFLMMVLCLLIVSLANAGGGNRAGTSAAPELLIPIGARDIALGGASVATTNGIDAIYWNPAGLARSSRSSEALFSYMSYIADMNVNYFAVSSSFSGFGTLAISLKALDIGDIPVTTEEAPDGTGEIISPTYVTVGATFSRLLAENISVGVTANLISERIERVNATGLAFNAGVQYSNLGGIGGLSIGVAMKNIGPQMKFEGPALYRFATTPDGRQGYYKVDAGSFELPSTIEIGASYMNKFSEDNSVTLMSLFQNNNFSDDEYKLGLEYAFRNMFFVRGGYDFAENTKDDNLTSTTGVDETTYIYGGTFGVGILYDVTDLAIGVDYAYRAAKFFKGNHVLTIRLGF
jgi:hypothetical protein